MRYKLVHAKTKMYNFLLGKAYGCQWESCSGRWELCTHFFSFRGRYRAPLPHPCASLCLVLMAKRTHQQSIIPSILGKVTHSKQAFKGLFITGIDFQAAMESGDTKGTLLGETCAILSDCLIECRIIRAKFHKHKAGIIPHQCVYGRRWGFNSETWCFSHEPIRLASPCPTRPRYCPEIS